MNELVNELLTDPTLQPLLLLDVFVVFLMIAWLASRCMRRGYYVEQANDGRKMEMLNIAVRDATGMSVHSAPDDWDDGWLTPCKFERDNGDIVPGAVEADGEGGLRVYEEADGSDSGYRFLGEAEYQEIWKKPSKRSF